MMSMETARKTTDFAQAQAIADTTDGGVMNLSFEEFEDAVTDTILQYMPEDYRYATVAVQLVDKNGGPHHGLTVKKKDSRIAPTIYVENLYKKYQDGEEVSDVIRRAAETIVKETEKIEESAENGTSADALSWVTDFEKVKDKIVPNLVSRSEAKRMDRPFIPFAGDLAVQFSVTVSNPATSDLGQAMVNINTVLMESYISQGFTIDDVAKAAVNNLGNPKMQTMQSIMMELMPDWMREMMPIEENPLKNLWVLTNERSCNGAAMLLDKGAMQAAQERIGDFYILPSSIHEVILVPKDFNGDDPEALRQMVMEVNGSTVDPIDKLSDNIYQFEEGEVRLVA